MKKEQGDQLEQAEAMYSKEQMLKCERYSDQRDLLNAVLADGEQYTHEQVDLLLEKYLKGRVN